MSPADSAADSALPGPELVPPPRTPVIKTHAHQLQQAYSLIRKCATLAANEATIEGVFVTQVSADSDGCV